MEDRECSIISQLLLSALVALVHLCLGAPHDVYKYIFSSVGFSLAALLPHPLPIVFYSFLWLQCPQCISLKS